MLNTLKHLLTETHISKIKSQQFFRSLYATIITKLLSVVSLFSIV